MRFLLPLLFLTAAAFGQINMRTAPYNSQLLWEDSARVDGTAAVTMKAAWQDLYAQKVLVIEARDDSSAGFSSDSAVVSVKVMQAFPFAKGADDYFVLLNSRANPDSTTKYGSSVFYLFDSLNILSMDTAAVYKRNRVAVTTTGGAYGTIAGDTAKTLQTTGFGAFAYTALPYDYSPAVIFKLKGLTGNASRGPGSMWRLRLYGLKGSMVKAGG